MPGDELGVLFTRNQAQRNGYSPDQIRHRIQTRQWSLVVGQVMTLGAIEMTPVLRDRAAMLAVPTGVLSGASAARWHGLDVGDDQTWITVPPGLRVRLPGIRVRREPLKPGDTVKHHGLTLTSLERTIFDCVRVMPSEHAEMLLLCAIDVGWLRFEWFLNRVHSHAGRHGVAHLLMLVDRVSRALQRRKGQPAVRKEDDAGPAEGRRDG